MGLPMPARSRQSQPKCTSMLVPISPKGVFQWETQILEIKKKGVVFIFNFGKLNSNNLIGWPDNGLKL